MPDPKDKRIELILQQLQQLPTLPAVALRVLEVTGQDESSARAVVELISSDPALTAKILQLLHRADVGVRGEINSVERAVVLLGFDVVRSAVLAISVFQALQPDPSRPATRFNREEFWKHSLAVACCAELLAAVPHKGGAPLASPSEAFVCGLLHDIGKVALDVMLPKSFDRIVEASDMLRGNIADLERTVVGLDHMVIGKRLAECWQLPAAVRECIWLHGQSPEALPATVKDARLVNLVTLADLLAREQHVGYSGNYTWPVPRGMLAQALNLTDKSIERVLQQLIGRTEERARTLGIGAAGSGDLYLSAIGRANQELARVSEQLALKSRRLAMRAKFFDALAQFQEDLRPDAPAALVLRAIGQTAVSALGVSPAAAFSIQPGQQVAEMVLVASDGECIGTSVVDCPAQMAVPAPGDGPVLSLGDEMEWLAEGVGPRLSGGKHYWICLQMEGSVIGAVLWGAGGAEAERLSAQAQELAGLCGGWSLALRTAQIREEARALSEQLAEANRRLQSTQNELLRSRTLASVGELAAGAAHEMNNPLAVISGRAQVLAGQLSDAKQRHAAQTIFDQSHRLSQIITDLMEFAKPVPPQPVATDLAELLDRALYDAKQLVEPAERKIELTMRETPRVVVDPQQVQAAFSQILHNALQATDERNGRIAIHAAYDAFSSRVVVTVTDNGCGMDPETLKRAFDPFFSAQAAGRRRGMGLAKALRWVECSGGSIRLESRPQQGTRAMVLLPTSGPTVSEGRVAKKAAGR